MNESGRRRKFTQLNNKTGVVNKQYYLCETIFTDKSRLYKRIRKRTVWHAPCRESFPVLCLRVFFFAKKLPRDKRNGGTLSKTQDIMRRQLGMYSTSTIRSVNISPFHFLYFPRIEMECYYNDNNSKGKYVSDGERALHYYISSSIFLPSMYVSTYSTMMNIGQSFHGPTL